MARLRVAEIAKAKGYTQKRLAEESHNAPGTINRYWNNYGKQVNLDTLEGIARALGVSLHELIDTEETKHAA
jgi:transcriptional regulator with XRE-family HTH domain